MNDGNAHERLVELGAERLADALIELAKLNSEANDIVSRMTASPNDNVERFKSKLAELRSANRCIDWRGASDFADELERMLADLEAGCDDPETGTDLMLAFFEVDRCIFEQYDDSCGCIGGVFDCFARDLLVRYASGYPDKARLAERIFVLCRWDDYGVRGVLLDSAREFLPEDTFRQLADRLQKTR